MQLKVEAGEGDEVDDDSAVRREESAAEESAASDADSQDNEADITGPNANTNSAALPDFIALGSSEGRSAAPRRERNKGGARGGVGGRRVRSPVGVRPLHSSRRFHKTNAAPHSSKQSHKHSKKQRN